MRIHVCLNDAHANDLKAFAAENGITVSALVRRILAASDWTNAGTKKVIFSVPVTLSGSAFKLAVHDAVEML